MGFGLALGWLWVGFGWGLGGVWVGFGLALGGVGVGFGWGWGWLWVGLGLALGGFGWGLGWLWVGLGLALGGGLGGVWLALGEVLGWLLGGAWVGLEWGVGPPESRRRGILIASTQNCSKVRFCLLQICWPTAPWLHSCSSERSPAEDVMLSIFIQAGCGQPSERSGECYRRERGISMCVWSDAAVLATEEFASEGE